MPTAYNYKQNSLLERFLKNFREGGLKLMFLTRGWMDETESIGMETESAQAFVGGAVFFIANDGVSKILGVDADLVFAAGFQMEVHQRVVLVANQHLIMGYGELAPVVGGAGIGDKCFVVFEP